MSVVAPLSPARTHTYARTHAYMFVTLTRFVTRTHSVTRVTDKRVTILVAICILIFYIEPENQYTPYFARVRACVSVCVCV